MTPFSHWPMPTPRGVVVSELLTTKVTCSWAFRATLRVVSGYLQPRNLKQHLRHTPHMTRG